jgi:hypothetical protein
MVIQLFIIRYVDSQGVVLGHVMFSILLTRFKHLILYSANFFRLDLLEVINCFLLWFNKLSCCASHEFRFYCLLCSYIPLFQCLHFTTIYVSVVGLLKYCIESVSIVFGLNLVSKHYSVFPKICKHLLIFEVTSYVISLCERVYVF